MDVESKTCPKCGQVFPATTEYFYRAWGTRDDLACLCKTCIAAAHRLYYQTHKEQYADYARARVAARKEEIAATHRAYRAAHPIPSRQTAVPKPSYPLVRKGEMAAIHRAWRAAHPKQAVVPRPGYAEYDRYGRLTTPETVLKEAAAGVVGPSNAKGGGC